MEERYEILVIDDNAGFAENLNDILSAHHYGVSLAGDGKSAVALVKKKDFDLVLTDINLPDISGLELAEKLSAISPHLEFIIITAYGTLETAIEAVKQKNIISFEVKPIDNHRLLSMIKQIREKKYTAEALHISEERFRIFSESATDAFLTIRENGIIVSLNPEFENIFGYKAREIMGKPLKSVIPQELPIMHGTRKKKMKDEDPVIPSCKRIEASGLHKSGREIPLEISCGHFRTKEGIFFTCIIRDISERKEKEHDLQVSEERYRLLVDSAPQPIVTLSRDGMVHFMNLYAASMFGIKPKVSAGVTLWDLIKKENADQLMKEVRTSLKSGPHSAMLCLSLLSGKEYCFSMHFQPIHLDSGTGSGCLVLFYDITERKIAEVRTQQRLEAEKIASLISERFVGIADFEKAVDDTLCDIGQYCNASRTFLLITDSILKNTITTYDWVASDPSSKKQKKPKPISIYGKFIREFSTGQDLIITDVNKIPAREKAMKATLTSMGVRSLFLLPITAKGSIVGYWGMDNFENPGDWTVEKFNLLVVISNIFSSAFHRRSVEQELAASEEIHRILMNASKEGIVLIDPRGRITEVSDIAMNLLGFGEKVKILGRNYLELVPKTLHDTMKEIMTKTIRDGITQNVELEMIRADKTQFSAEVSTTLIPGSGEDLRGFMLAIRDITERKKVEKQLIHTERMAGIGEMAAGIAHEINQPLNTISLTLDNLLFSFRNGEFDKEYLETKTHKLFQNITRMRNIIDHVRTFSRQNDDYILGNFNVNDSVRNAVSMVSEQFKHKGINLELNLNDNIKMPVGNLYKFEQVILNLIINAKDALEEKKKKTQKDFSKSIVINSFENKEYIFIEVTDNGVGIEPDKIEKVFLPFYTSKETGSGTGLGLSISFGIIKDMHGNIEAESKVMKSTTIRITIPVDPKKRASSGEEKPVPSETK